MRHRRLCASSRPALAASIHVPCDVTDTLNLALQASGLEQVAVVHRPGLLSDNGPCYVSGELMQWLERERMRHTGVRHFTR